MSNIENNQSANEDWTPGAEWQGVVLHVGDGMPIFVGDQDHVDDIRGWVESDGQRAVLATRLERILSAIRS